MKVLVTGGTGFIGSAIVEALLARGDAVVVTGRSAKRVTKRFGDRVEACEWNPVEGPLPVDVLRDVDGVINLAGENIAKGRWTRAKKARIRDSRITGTRNLVAGIAAATRKPTVLVSASAIGIYGDTAHRAVHEGATRAHDFLADLCADWEAAARTTELRVAIVRTGVVLGCGGGAYPPMRRLFRCFAGGTIGLGKSWFSWIHIDDLVGIFLKALDDENANEAYNGTAPHPVSNMEFTRELARSLHRPALAPVPPIMLRIALGEFGSFVTMSQRVVPIRTIGIGYEYKYPRVREALESLA